MGAVRGEIMFEVLDRKSGKVRTVFAVQGLHFLIYEELPEETGWRWIEMADCVPVVQG